MTEARAAALRAAAAIAPTPVSAAPTAWALSNGRISTVVSARGTGFTCDGELSLTRWSADRVEDRDGVLLYVRDRDGGAAWSAGLRPMPRAPERSSAAWEPGVVHLSRTDDGIETRLDVCVAADAPVELRRVTLRNRSTRPRTLEVTSYVEVVLAPGPADAAHPAFSRLFVQTHHDAAHQALCAERRPRAADERWPCLAHALVGAGVLEYETDRARFIGRGRSVASPLALEGTARLSGTTGPVLDPVLSLRRTVTLAPGAEARFGCVLATAEDRARALARVAEWSVAGRIDDEFDRVAERARRELRLLDVSEVDAARYQSLVGALAYGEPGARDALEGALAPEEPGTAPASGPSPEGLLVVADARDEATLRGLPDLMRAHRYWRAMGLSSEVLVIASDPERVRPLAGGDGQERVWVRRAARLPEGELARIAAGARLVLGRGRSTLEPPESEAMPEVATPPAGRDGRAPRAPGTDAGMTFTERLQCFNGIGGFNEAGDEYVIRLTPDASGRLRLPPRPWVNVIANDAFGMVVSETGAGCTWSANSREHRLTPWSNDPVVDPHGEALYVRDDESGAYWSPLPGPAPGPGAYEVRHGFGYSRWRHGCDGLEQETCTFVPLHDGLRIRRVRLTNRSARVRRLSLFACDRMVLGALPQVAGRTVVTRVDAAAGVVLAVNPSADAFAERVAFATAVTAAPVGALRFSGDRAAFLGPAGDAARPEVLASGAELEGRTGAGLDPCLAVQVSVVVAPGETVECDFLLGEVAGPADLAALLARYRAPEAVSEALRAVRAFWSRTLGAVQVHTPSAAIDLMMNGWLLYQTLACRMWGRTAFYQSGGAFGFRDQLQDAGAFAMVRPELLRAQILLHAGHQFVEGDVLHWWHPPLDRGMRTHFADDRLWLPYLTATYVRATGDDAILEATAPYLAARPLAPGEDEAFLQPEPSGTSADLYAHCCAAIDRSLARGERGLPLFGTGDWNDGMNRVGREGRGESVWMGFFLFAVLGEFIPLCEGRGDTTRADAYVAHREALRRALDGAGWDGEWYRRGWYDDGTPLGTREGDECRIDALVQAWAVISGAAPAARADQALDAVERLLISDQDRMIRLLAPAFDRTTHDPGYIKGYLPGIRENGGQYTHAALWVVRAMAERGRRDRAAHLLEMLSPVGHAGTPATTARYGVEPYVVAADVYGEPPHVGQGGWTWYTGSSGWMFRVALESVLGVRIMGGDRLEIRPCIPAEWDHFGVTWRMADGATVWEIVVRNPGGASGEVASAVLDGVALRIEGGAAVAPIVRDGASHRLEVELR